MIIRPKTKRRLLVLLCAAVVIGSLGAWIVHYRLAVAQKRIEQNKIDGLAAYKQGRYDDAIGNLEKFRSKYPDDPDALLAYGMACSKMADSDPTHARLFQAIEALRSYCSGNPEDIDTKHYLLKLELPVPAFAGAARELASALVTRDPNDLEALKTFILLEVRDEKFQDPQLAQALKNYTTKKPSDLEIQQTNLYVMSKSRKSARDLHDVAAQFQKDHPGDPRFFLIQAMAYFYGADPGETPEQRHEHERDLVKSAAAAKELPDVQFVQAAISALDRLHEFGTSLALLTRAADKFNDPDIQLMLVQRLWQTYFFQDVVDRLKNLDPALPTANINLIAYKTMALYGLFLQSKKPADQIASLIVALGHMNGDSAKAWSMALNTYCSDALDELKAPPDNKPKAGPTDKLKAYQAALAKDPANMVIEGMLADACQRLGENELALQHWRTVSRAVPSWPEPAINIALILAREGHGDAPEARMAAELANQASERMDPGARKTTADAAITRVIVSYAALITKSKVEPKEVNALLNDIKNIQAAIPGEPNTLPMYVDLLAQTKQNDQATKEIQDAIDRHLTDESPDQHQDLLLRLEQVSRRDGLHMDGEEGPIEAGILAQYGLTPQLAFERASRKLQSGQPDEGLKEFVDAQNKAASTGSGQATVNSKQWQRYYAQYLEDKSQVETRAKADADKAQAARSWEALGKSNPDDLIVQSVILAHANSLWDPPANSPDNASGRQFLQDTITRLKALTGDQAIEWQVAQARWFLGSNDIPSAIAILNKINKDFPDQYTVHVVLALAREKQNDGAEALKEWGLAAKLAPAPIAYTAQFDLLRASFYWGTLEDTQAAFDSLMALAPNLGEDDAVGIARLIAEKGDLARAQTLLEKYPSGPGHVAHDATLAKIYRLAAQNDRADRLYLSLENMPGLDEATIRETADFRASHPNGLADARQFIKRQPDASLLPGHREWILAELEERYGDPEEAGKLYKQAVDLSAVNANDTLPAFGQIGFLLRHHESGYTPAQIAIEAAKKRWPNDPQVDALLATRRFMEGGESSHPALAPVVEALSREPNNAAALETMRTISPITDIAAIAPQLILLIKKYPGFLPLYEAAISQYTTLDQRNQAVGIADQMMERFPGSAEAAKYAALAYVMVQRWNEAVAAAQLWRTMGNAEKINADLLIAQIDLGVNHRPDKAVSSLEPYFNDIKDQLEKAKLAAINPGDSELIPAESVNVLAAYGNALIRDKRQARAAQDLLPMAKYSQSLRVNMLLISSACPDAASAMEWIGGIKPLFDAGSLKDQNQVAQAYLSCGFTRPFPEDLAKEAFVQARQTLQPLLSGPDIGAGPDVVKALLTYSDACLWAGDDAAAEAGYKRVLKIDDDQPGAKNNLADILLKRGDPDSLKQAETYASQAVAKISPNGKASAYDTWAWVLAKEGRIPDAMDKFDKGHQLEPGNVDLLIGLTWACASSKPPRIDQARGYLAQIESLSRGVTSKPQHQAELDTAKDILNSNRRSSLTDTH